jgi:hypothetical protein
MKVKYNNTTYISICFYEESQDGIFYYAKEIDTRIDLSSFLSESELGISALFFGFISQCIIEENLNIFAVNIKNLIIENEVKLLKFHSKYFDDYIFNYKFLDLVYGPSGMPIKHEDEMKKSFYVFEDNTEMEILDEISYEYLNQNMFINTEYYNEFCYDINYLIG